MTRLIRTFIILSFFCTEAFAQTPVVNATINRSNILIGEPIQLRIETTIPDNAVRIKWFSIPDSIPHFEVIERSKIDSSAKEGSLTVSQVITLTSFDSGRCILPAFEGELFLSGSDSTFHLFTDSMPVNVSWSPLDSTKTFHDIKEIIEVSDERPWWEWVIIGVIVLILVVMIWFILKQFKRTRSGEVPEYSAYDEAMLALTELEKEQLLMQGAAGKFHTRLSNIFRRYASRQFSRNMMNLTSAEMLLNIKDDIAREDLSSLATALRMGDAVKFAKYLPPVTESEAALHEVKSVINKMNQSKTAESDI